MTQIYEAASSTPTDPLTAIEAYHRMTAKPDTKLYTAILKTV
jgi:hypothetical protein